MKLYRVKSYEKHHFNPDVSSGYSTRAAAERFAAGLASAGKCVSADIESYEDDEDDEDDDAEASRAYRRWVEEREAEAQA